MPQRLGFRAAPKNLKALFLPQRTNMLFFWKSRKFEYVITCQAFLTTRFSCMLLSASLPMAFPTRFWFVFTFSFSFSCTLVFGLYSPLWNQKGLVPRHSITPHSGSKLVDSTLLKLLRRLRAPFSHPQPQSAQCYLKSNVVSIGILQTSNRKGLGRTKKDVAALARRGVVAARKGSPRRHLTCSLRIIEKVKENGRWHFHKNLNKPKGNYISWHQTLGSSKNSTWNRLNCTVAFKTCMPDWQQAESRIQTHQRIQGQSATHPLLQVIGSFSHTEFIRSKNGTVFQNARLVLLRQRVALCNDCTIKAGSNLITTNVSPNMPTVGKPHITSMCACKCFPSHLWYPRFHVYKGNRTTWCTLL